MKNPAQGKTKGAQVKALEMARVLRTCERCGAEIFPDEQEGLCVACLLETSLETFHDNPDREPDTEIPGELGDYELIEEIGRGGQGLVYRARQKSLNRIVALKIIGLGRWATKAHIKRFHLEAEAAASLNHPCIVPIHEIGENDGLLLLQHATCRRPTTP